MTQTTLRSASTTAMAADRALAAAMLLAPLLGAVATGMTPAVLNERHGDDRTKTLHVLSDAASNRGSLILSMIVVALALGLMAPAAIGLARATGGRTGAVYGAALVCVAVPMAIVGNVASTYLLYRVTTPGVPSDSGVDVLAYQSGALFFVILALSLFPLVVGLVTLGVSLARSRAVPRWVGALIAVGGVLSFVAPEGPVGALCTLPLIVGFGLVALRPSPRQESSEAGSWV
jgi:hypothetical protein